jgi:putative ABC transport system permease protein
MRRALGVVSLGARRIVGRLLGGESRQILLSIVGVALAIALMTTVSGVALNLASGSTVAGDDVDYWVVPEASSSSSIAVPVSGPTLGGVHPVTDRLAADDRIEYATPVLLRVLEVENPASGTSEYVLLAGVIPPRGGGTVLGLPTADLTPGDPHYANGSYDGAWTGEAVASEATASLLEFEQGATLRSMRQPNRSFTATSVHQSEMQTGTGSLPILLVHLSELQTLSGADNGDQASQLLVSTNTAGVKPDLEALYPHTTVLSRGGISEPDVSTSSLPLAVAVAALVATVAVGVLFVATMMGLEVTGDRKQLATLAAMGFSARSRSLLVLAETVAVAFVGGCLGVLLGVLAIEGTNAAARAYFSVETVATFHPLLLVYGIGIALGIGVLSSLYPVWLSARTDTLEVLRR